MGHAMRVLETIFQLYTLLNRAYPHTRLTLVRFSAGLFSRRAPALPITVHSRSAEPRPLRPRSKQATSSTCPF